MHAAKLSKKPYRAISRKISHVLTLCDSSGTSTTPIRPNPRSSLRTPMDCVSTGTPVLLRPGDSNIYHIYKGHRVLSKSKCNRPIYHVGQDEAVFKLHSLPSYYWVIDGMHKLRPKGDGSGIMISAMVDEHRGFRFPITAAEIMLINAARIAKDKPPLSAESPGRVMFEYGSGPGRDGYWNSEKFNSQVEKFNLIERADL